MDAHLFRRFAARAIPLLVGARLSKIQEPEKDVFTFLLDLFQRDGEFGRKAQLVLKCGRKEPFLFLSRTRVSANASPSAKVMRLRKYVGGRSVRHAEALWLSRELWLLMSGSMPAEVVNRFARPKNGTEPDWGEAGMNAEAPEFAEAGDEPQAHSEDKLVWVVLSLRHGPRLHFASPDEFPREDEPSWPDRRELAEALENWHDWPVLTPSLRRALSAMEDAPDQAALVVDLEEGEGDVFVYREPASGTVRKISAWPLQDWPKDGTALEEEVREDILKAVADAGASLVLEECARANARRVAEPWAKKEKKLRERLALQQEDVERLAKMAARREQGLLLQASLWQLQQDKSQDRRMESVEVLDNEGKPVALRLDPRLTVRENMEKFFHTARRGERGLARIGARTRELEEELAETIRQKEACLSGGVQAPRKDRAGKQSVQLPNLPNSVQLFISSDGFALLRGRSAKGNQDARRVASPHDLWVHAEGGPGAHVIIRRSHAGQNVPARTLDEAGALAAARSWLKDEPRATLTYCEVRHVRPLKGAGQGTMRMDKVLFTRTVAVDPGLEERLTPKA